MQQTELKHDVSALLEQMAQQLRRFLEHKQRENPLMVGIHTGGVWVAEHLHRLLELPDSLGHVNIAFYRDDFSRIGLHPHVTTTALPFQIEDRHVILVDDVLYSGRTVRAALNELFDYGRPASVTLAVLVDRNAHELPIQADITGLTLDLQPPGHIKLNGPQDLTLVMQTPL